MPSVASTAPAAKAAILALISARPALAAVTCTWGGPTASEDVKEEMIYLGDVVVEGEWIAFGANRRDEAYTVELRAHVLKYGDDERGTEERSWALLDEVSAALTADKYLGGLLKDAVALDSIRQTNTPIVDQWGTLIIAQIHCAAHFTP